MSYSLQQVQQAIKLAHSEGNTDAVNSLVDFYNNQYQQERSSFKEHEPSGWADIPPQISETAQQGMAASERKYKTLSGMVEQDKVHAEEMPALSLGVAAPVVGSVFEAGLKTAGQVASILTPDYLEVPVIEAVKGQVFDFIQKPNVQEGLRYATNKASEYFQWASENKEDALRLESIVDVGLMSLPPTKVPPVTEAMDRASVKLLDVGRVQGINKRHDQVWRLLEPLKLDKDSLRRTEIKGPLGTKTTSPSPMQEESIKVVSLIPDVRAGKTFTHNFNAIHNEIESTAKRLIKRIDREGNPQVDMKALVTGMQREVDSFINSPDIHIAGSATPKRTQAFIDKTVQLLKESDGSAKGVLEARKQLDDYIQQGHSLDPEYLDSKGAALKIIRDHLNSAVAEAVPKVDVDGLLRKQFLMYNAGDVVGDKAIDEARNSIARTYANIHRVTGTSLPTTPLALAATAGGAGALMTEGVLFYGSAGLALVAGGTLALKALSSPQTKKALGVLLGGANKAIKASKNKEMIEQLKADRLVIISLLQQEEDKTQRVPMKGAAN